MPSYLKKREDAISPVIGVMLMLVVTIMIAAAIAAFATGTFDDSDSSPTVMLDVRNPSSTSFDIVHTGGDLLLFKDIVVSVTPMSNQDSGLTKIYQYPASTISILGKTASDTSVITVGDTIRVNIGAAASGGGSYPIYTPIIWKILDAKSTQILAEGEFVIPPST